MKEINKLVHLVTHGLKSNFGVIDLTGQAENPGKEQQLYNGVLEGIYHDDEVTAKGMYGSNVYDQRFRMLKSRLRYKLYDLLYHLDFEIPAHNFTTQKRLECHEYIHKATILYELGEYGMAEKQYNKVLVLAGECQFTDKLIQANELKRKVLADEFKPTDFELTLQELDSLRYLKKMEDEAEDLFLKTELLLSKSIHSRNVNVDTALHTVKELERLYKETNSYNIYEKLYKIKIWVCNLQNDFEKLIAYLKEVPAHIQNIEVTPERFDLAFNNLMLAKTYLRIEKYSEGLALAEKGYAILDKSTPAWFSHAEVHFLLGVRSKDYAIAQEVLNNTLKNPNFNRAPIETINRWKIFKLYLNFAQPELGIQKRIRFYDIYESSDAYFNELKGYKISLYLLDFIHQTNKESQDAESKLEELDSFFYKHLNDPGKNQREKQFIKMLKVLRTSGFDVEETREKTATYLQRMGEKKAVNAFADFEIIAYEDLWEMVLNVVKAREKVLH